MPYPQAIVTMAQNLLQEIADDPDIHENRFYMLWISILTFYFPIIFQYRVALQTFITGTGTKSGFLVVKIVQESESIVLVVGLKKPSEDMDTGRENIREELLDFIGEQCEETEFITTYAIGGIGLSWSVFKTSVTAAPEPVFDWMSNITAAKSFNRISELALMIDQMAGTARA